MNKPVQPTHAPQPLNYAPASAASCEEQEEDHTSRTAAWVALFVCPPLGLIAYYNSLQAAALARLGRPDDAEVLARRVEWLGKISVSLLGFCILACCLVIVSIFI